MSHRFSPCFRLPLLLVAAMGLGGCATQDFVQQEVQGVNQRLASLESQLAQAGKRIDANAAQTQATESRLGQGEHTARTLNQQLADLRTELAGANQNLAGMLMAMNASDRRSETNAADSAALQQQLVHVRNLIGEIHQRITVNTSTLQNLNLRQGELAQGLTAVQNGTAVGAQRLDANTAAIAGLGRRADIVEAGLRVAHTRLDQAESRVGETSERIARNEASDAVVSATARDALVRAQAADKLAQGTLLAETVLSDEIAFAFGQTRLSEAGGQALLAFADKLKAENKGWYIEVQGYTDNHGTPDANLSLSRQRAEAVRDFLNQSAGIPMHRLAVAAYGAARPIADNKTREGRAKNRRVVLVVLK